jgi:hypothetical protein
MALTQGEKRTGGAPTSTRTPRTIPLFDISQCLSTEAESTTQRWRRRIAGMFKSVIVFEHCGLVPEAISELWRPRCRGCSNTRASLPGKGVVGRSLALTRAGQTKSCDRRTSTVLSPIGRGRHSGRRRRRRYGIGRRDVGTGNAWARGEHVDKGGTASLWRGGRRLFRHGDENPLEGTTTRLSGVFLR